MPRSRCGTGCVTNCAAVEAISLFGADIGTHGTGTTDLCHSPQQETPTEAGVPCALPFELRPHEWRRRGSNPQLYERCLDSSADDRSARLALRRRLQRKVGSLPDTQRRRIGLRRYRPDPLERWAVPAERGEQDQVAQHSEAGNRKRGDAGARAGEGTPHRHSHKYTGAHQAHRDDRGKG